MCSPNQGLCSPPSYVRGTETIKHADTSQRQESTAIESIGSGTSLPGSNSACAIAGCVTFRSYLISLCLSLLVSKMQVVTVPLSWGRVM